MALRFDSHQAELNLRRMEVETPAIVARALNRAMSSTRVFMRRKVANDIGLTQTVVEKDYRVFPARADNLKASLEVRGKRIPLIKFGATGPLPTRGRPPYVTAKIGGARTVYGPTAGQATPFKAKLQSGHIGVFRRFPLPSMRLSRGAWGKNLPIVELRGPSLVRVFTKFIQDGLEYGEAQVVANLEREMVREMRSLSTA
jgi:Prophage minor tail protein Z (GPZ)